MKEFLIGISVWVSVCVLIVLFIAFCSREEEPEGTCWGTEEDCESCSNRKNCGREETE